MVIIEDLDYQVGSLENNRYIFDMDMSCSLPYRQLSIWIVLKIFNAIRVFTLSKMFILYGAEL